jgi:hypothetical protein
VEKICRRAVRIKKEKKEEYYRYFTDFHHHAKCCFLNKEVRVRESCFIRKIIIIIRAVLGRGEPKFSQILRSCFDFIASISQRTIS